MLVNDRGVGNEDYDGRCCKLQAILRLIHVIVKLFETYTMITVLS